MPSKKIAVIGGGIAALACAHRLRELSQKEQTDFQILLLEAGSRTGGNIETEVRDGFILEKGPDSFLSDKPAVLNLSQRLGIANQLTNTQPLNRKILIASKDQLVALPEGFYLMAPTRLRSLLRTSLFSVFGKMRMACEMLIPRNASEEDESVAQFIHRRFGREALEILGQPLVAGIHAGNPEELSLQSVLPRFKEMEKYSGSVIRALMLESARKKTALRQATGPRYSLFLSFDQGMQVLPDALSRALNGSIQLSRAVKQIEWIGQESKWRLSMSSGQMETADALCLALPAKRSAALLETVAPELTYLLRKISYHSVATLNFAYRAGAIRRPLDSFGFVVPAKEKKSILACTFCSQKFSGRAPKDHVLLRAFVGGHFGQDYFQKNDKDLKDAVQKDLEGYLGIAQAPLFTTLCRFTEGLPQYKVGHQALIDSIETALHSMPSLFLAGSAYRGSGIPDAVQDAELQAEKIHSLLKQRTPSLMPV